VEVNAVVKELQRELAMREKLYPGWVRDGKLSQKTADHRILAINQAIALVKLVESLEVDQCIDEQLSLLEAIG